MSEISAIVVGKVHYRVGDGMLEAIRVGPVRVQVCGADAVLGWYEAPHRNAVAMPFDDFGRYVDEGAIRVLERDARHADLSATPAQPSITDHQEQGMTQRIDYYKASREAMSAMLTLEKAVGEFGLEASLRELVKLRASQINGCGYCVDVHTTEARKLGESERRLHSVIVWREAPFFTPRERAALAWTEALTRLPESHAPDEDYALLREHFSDREMVELTVAIIAVNGWNRLGVGFRRSAQT